MSQMTAPKISVLGDGISSFEGYVPRQASFYSPSYVSYSGFDTPDGMWWMQLTKMLGGEFLANSAYAGSHVSYAGHYSACLPRRIRSLATEEASPDIILVYSGINDVNHSIELDKFQRDYTEMLDSLKKFHPNAQIWAGTLTVGKEPAGPYYLDPVALEKRGEYNDIIRQCVAAAGDRVHLVDLSPVEGVYETVNGTHPNKQGMITFAEAWYKVMKDAI
ncbi:SGNH/GDSL hydrolase family protein [Evtepia sp.]